MNVFKSRASCPTTTHHSRRAAVVFVVFCGLAGAPHAVFADSDVERLTIQQFAARVEHCLPEYGLVDADVLEAEADLAQAGALPPIELAVDREEVFTEGRGVALKNAVSIGWSLDISGRRGLRMEAAQGRVRATRQVGRRVKHLLVLDAIERYLRAARARLRVESLQATREPLAGLVQSLKRRAAAGDVSGVDLARFELALASHDDRLAQAETEAMIAERRLGALCGTTRPVRADDRLALPAAPADATQAAALAGRADLQATREEQRSGRALIRAAGRWWIPGIELAAGYLNTDFGPGTGAGAGVAHGYLATLSLTVPIFSRGRAEKKRGQAQLRRAGARRKLLEQRIAGDVQSAQARLQSHVDRARAHEKNQLALAEELVRKTRAAYNGGEATALELRDAYREQTDAVLRSIDLRLGARLAKIALLRVTGSKTGVLP